MAEAGLLQALVTDANAGYEPAGLAARALELLAPGALARLRGRRIPDGIAPTAVHSYLVPSMQLAIVDKFGPHLGKSARRLHRLGIGGNQLARHAIAANYFDADTLYVHPCVATEAVHEARKRGMRVVIEAISHPFNKRIELAEFERYGVKSDQSAALVEDNIAFFFEEAKLADCVLAASPYVRSGLLELGLPANRVAIVRYGLDTNSFADVKPAPTPGRVLYVGAVNYLKGIPTLSAAARQLASHEGSIEVHVVGPLARGVAGRPEFEGPCYHGQVLRLDVRRHFAEADVFVFPSLSDGFGLVLLEAMSAGLPVISTRNCADLVRHGKNGLLVPDRDPVALAEAIRSIVEDRDLRARMSHGALETAAKYTIAGYGQALADAVCSINDAPAQEFRVATN